jgi:two-component system C4-dicarboxylate transport sensor histidine kinase DctB
VALARHHALSRSARAYVEATRQYPGWAFQPLDWRERQLGGGAVRQVRLDSQSPYVDYLVDERGVSAQGWRLMLFADATPILLASRAARLGTFLLLLTLAAIGLVLQQRQRRIRERLAARTRWPRPTASWRTRSKRAPPTCARPTRPWPRR